MNIDDLKATMPKPPLEPDTVYHYTTIDTMLKIVKDAQIWATSIEYLNDAKERTHFLELIRERVPEYKKLRNIQSDGMFKRLLEDRHLMRSVPERLPFVASFLLVADSLPQWRSYCPNGNGVSIGFRTECLRRATVSDTSEKSDSITTKSPPTIQAKCVEYPRVQDTEHIDWLLSLFEWAAVYPQGRTDGVDTLDLISYLCEHEACSKKNPSFSNEEEYRLLVSGIPFGSSSLQFRTTRSALVPYVALSIPRNHSQYEPESTASNPLTAWASRWDFVDRVVIGPTPNMTLSQTALEAFFRSQNMAVHVRTSQIPYRDW